MEGEGRKRRRMRKAFKTHAFAARPSLPPLPPLQTRQTVTQLPEILTDSTVIGIFNRTFIVLLHEGRLWFVDIHGVCERKLYNYYVKTNKPRAAAKLACYKAIRAGEEDVTKDRMEEIVRGMAGEPSWGECAHGRPCVVPGDRVL